MSTRHVTADQPAAEQLQPVLERIAQIDAETTRLKDARDALVAHVKTVMDAAALDEVDTPAGTVTWRPTKPVRRLDQQALKAGYPDVYAACVVETEGTRPFKFVAHTPDTTGGLP